MKPAGTPRRVAILSTGRTEWHGLASALGRLFYGHDFQSVPTQMEVDSYHQSYPYPGFTTCALSPHHVEHPPESARDLIARAAQEALGSTKANKPPADLVVIVDDLELANRDQPEQAVAVFRAAVRQHLAGLQGCRDRTARALQERVSFHLIVPMIESWFFADPGALQTAGVPAERSVAVQNEHDPELFWVDEPAYLAASDADCPCWAALPGGTNKKKQRPKWLGEGPRQAHAKGYLQWLCIDGSQKNCTTYDETRKGSAALRSLDWDRVLLRPPMQLQFLAALLDDIAVALGQPLGGLAERVLSPLTCLAKRPTDAVLRNL